MIEVGGPDVGAYCIRPCPIEVGCPDVGAYCIRPCPIEVGCPDVGAYCIRPCPIYGDVHRSVRSHNTRMSD